MSEKISYSSWKAFIKKQKLEDELDDKELVRVLSKFDKTDESKLGPRLEALEDVIKEIPKQVSALVKLKKKLGDKPFGLVKDELYAILEEAEKLQKKTRDALDAENDKDDEDEEDEDSAPNLLADPKLLLKQLTMCKRDPDRTMNFAYIDGKGKEQPPVLAMHPKLSAKKLFSKLQIATKVKTGAFGSAWIDGTSLMLQLDKPLSGLVKKVRGPVKACGFKIAKAVLWNADGTVFEQDDEPDNAADATGADAPATAAAKTIPPAPPGPAVKTPAAKTATAAAPAASPESTAFMARLKALLAKAAEVGNPALLLQAKLLGSEAGVALREGDSAKVDELMRQAEALFATGKAAPGASPADTRPAQETGTKPSAQSEEDLDTAWLARFETTEKVYLEVMKRQPADAGKLRAVMDFANGKALAKQYAAARQALDRLDGMLAKVLATTPPGASAASGERSDGRQDAESETRTRSATSAKVRFEQLHLDWDGAKQKVQERLNALHRAIVEEWDDTDAQTAAGNLAKVLARFDEGLGDTLDGMRNLAPGPQRKAMADKASAIADRYLQYLSTNELVGHVEVNPFDIEIGANEHLSLPLNQLKQQLEAISA